MDVDVSARSVWVMLNIMYVCVTVSLSETTGFYLAVDAGAVEACEEVDAGSVPMPDEIFMAILDYKSDLLLDS